MGYLIIVLERGNVGDKWLIQMSKELVIDQAIPYEVLKDAIEEDCSQEKITKYYANCLGMSKLQDGTHIVIYPNHKKNEVNIDRIRMSSRDSVMTDVTPLASNVRVMANNIQQLEVYN